MSATVHPAKPDDPQFVALILHGWLGHKTALLFSLVRCSIAACDSDRRLCSDGHDRPSPLANNLYDFVAFEEGAHTFVEQGEQSIFRHRQCLYSFNLVEARRLVG